MNLSIKELNELIYSLGITASKGIFVNKELNASLIDKLYSELNSKIAIQSDITDEVIDRVKSHYVSNEEADEDVSDWDVTLMDGLDEEVESSTYYVSNEEADEDYRVSLLQDSNRYESSVEKDYDNHLSKLKQRGYITQTLLDYVDKKGAVSHGDLETYYKIITGGSNSFSHILESLRTPYKNRKTQRYIAKEGKRYSDAKYVIKVANPSNWVIVDC
jgi:uncharacterized membrane protein YheB (UPF0754 family)